MVTPTNLLDLALNAEGLPADANVSEAVARAAEIVEGFAETAAPQALEALLAAAGRDRLAQAAGEARELARQALMQAQVLSDEVGRFMSMAVES